MRAVLVKYLFFSMFLSVLKSPISSSAGITAFEMEYAHWMDEQNRLICELRTALHAHISDLELRMLVENGMNHYFELFRMKATAAKADVFYVMSGMWKTSAERFFLWIGGFRPSELLKVLYVRAFKVHRALYLFVLSRSSLCVLFLLIYLYTSLIFRVSS